MKVFVFFILIPLSALAESDTAQSVLKAPVQAESIYGLRPGYTNNVDDEAQEEAQEMLLVDRPDGLDRPPVQEVIFNSELSNEFLFRYQQQFGRTEAEEKYFLINQQGYYISPGGLTAKQEDAQRRKFAEYMMKRLAEFHTENILKTEPKFKKIYEIKQTISNVEVHMSPQTKFNMSYSFVGNFLTLGVMHPTVAEFISTVNMDPASLYPTQPKEVIFMARRPLALTVIGETAYKIYERTVRLLVSKSLAPTTTVYVAQNLPIVSSPLERDEEGKLLSPIDSTRETLTLLGLSVTF